MWNQGIGGEGGKVSWRELRQAPPPCSWSSQANVRLNHSAHFEFYRTIRALLIQNRRMLHPWYRPKYL